MIRKLKPQPQKPKIGRAPERQREQRILLFIWITVPLLIVISLGLVGFWWYDNYVGVWHQTVATVNGTAINLRQFEKLLLYTTEYSNASGQTTTDPSTLAQQTLSQMEQNQLVEQGAAKLGISVTTDEVNQKIQSVLENIGLLATPAPGGTVSQGDFSKAYNKWLSNIKLPEADFRQLIVVSLLQQKVTNYLKQQNVPASGEEVHLFVLQTGSLGTAAQLEDRIKNGEDFAAVAKVQSTDQTTRDIGGDLGWVPKGILTNFDSVAFSIQPGAVSDPISYSQSYYLVMVSEKADNRTIDDSYRQTLASNAFTGWLNTETGSAKIVESLDQTKITRAADQVTKELK